MYDDSGETLLTSCYGVVPVHSKNLNEKEDRGWRVRGGLHGRPMSVRAMETVSPVRSCRD